MCTVRKEMEEEEGRVEMGVRVRRGEEENAFY